MTEPSEEFWESCLNEADAKFKGHFPRLEKRAFILGCAYGYGAYKADIKTERARSAKLEAGLKFFADLRKEYEASGRGYKHHDGNSPGHGHTRPGIWDDDNQGLSGRRCAQCYAWNELTKLLEDEARRE